MDLTDAMGEAGILAELSDSRPQFLRYVRLRIDDATVAEDILQTAYVDAARRAGDVRNREMAQAWFYRILRNRVIDHYRHRAVEERVLAPMAEDFDPACAEEERSHLCQCMNQAIEGLKPEYADALRSVDLSEDHGALARYAEQASITSKNAAVRGHRARKALARQLQKICGSCAGAGCLDCTCGDARGKHPTNSVEGQRSSA